MFALPGYIPEGFIRYRRKYVFPLSSFFCDVINSLSLDLVDKSDDKINCHKIQKNASILNEVVRFQKMSYQFEDDEAVQLNLKRLLGIFISP